MPARSNTLVGRAKCSLLRSSVLTVRACENFATGFWFAGTERADVWGRPVGLAIAKDGSPLIADDVSQSIWRMSYKP